jgi:hypothetical protein
VSWFVSSGCSAAPGAVIFFGGMTKVDVLPKIVEVSTPEVGANALPKIVEVSNTVLFTLVGDLFSNAMN